MASYELTEAADRDLTGIYSYSYQQFGATQADIYFLSLHDCFGRLAEFPTMGRSIAHLRAGYFRFEHASHVVFYVRIRSGIRVIRILHQRQEPDRHL
jgi:toxin ParE1/3/4